MNYPFRTISLTVIGLIFLGGCRGGDEVTLGKVEGTVKMDGKPLPDATLRFRPLAGGRNAIGRTDENGHYELAYSATAQGAVVGKMRVEITVSEEEETADGRTRITPELVPPKYNEHSELTAEVTDEGNVIDFELTSR